ncbi:hypothetical protein [Helicobacter sp. T3_23-1059]
MLYLLPPPLKKNDKNYTSNKNYKIHKIYPKIPKIKYGFADKMRKISHIWILLFLLTLGFECANAAACRHIYDTTKPSLQTIACDGYIFASDLSKAAFNTTFTQTESYTTTEYHIGSATTSATIAPARIVAYFRKINESSTRWHNVRFRNALAPNTIFDFRNQKSGADLPVSLTMEVADSTIGGLIITGTMDTLSIFGAGFIRNLSGGIADSSHNNGESNIKTLIIGERTTINGIEQGVGIIPFGSNTIDIKVDRLEIKGISLTINSGNEWNGNPADTTKNTINIDSTKEQHLILAKSDSASMTHNVRPRSIIINIGDNAKKGVEYKYENLILTGSSTNASKLGGNYPYNINSTHIIGGQGVKLVKNAQGFSLEADISTSQGASLYRALTLSYMRRDVMTQNILDTMTTKTFHSDDYYAKEEELKALQQDMTRLTARSSRFSKLTRAKNQDTIDKVRQKVAQVTLEQSKGQNLKPYNNLELIDQLDAIFIPYQSRRDYRFFALPYSALSLVDMGTSNATELAGGALFGIQKNLSRRGIYGAYLGYEFVNTTTKLLGQNMRVQTNALQTGMNYFKTFAFYTKAQEGFIKANVRAGVDFPNIYMNVAGQSINLASNSSAVSIPLMWSVGAEIRTGITFYQFRFNSHISPEIALSYDMLSSIDLVLQKPTQIGANERHNAILWHLPQASFALRYYKMWGNIFRTNFKAGVRYNVFHTQKAKFKIGNFENEGNINLPLAYGNLALDFIWILKQNHELSLGYDGLFYANSFDKDVDRFNGVTTTLNLKYAYWFGAKKLDKPAHKNANTNAQKQEKARQSRLEKEREKQEKARQKKAQQAQAKLEKIKQNQAKKEQKSINANKTKNTKESSKSKQDKKSKSTKTQSAKIQPSKTQSAKSKNTKSQDKK